MLEVELVLETRAAAALDADPQHGTTALALEDFANAAGGPLADGDGCGHGRLRWKAYLSRNSLIIAKCCGQRNQTGLPRQKTGYPVSVGMAAPCSVYACDPDHSRGRQYLEPPSRTRSPFRRDCDRVIHCTAFRRLKHKTQVFVFHEGDHYRTRLTHTLEVAQIARALARQLGLDEDLTETLALAHDLGHPPFGHAGERALDTCLGAFGGFDHNAQTLRVVTALERRYPAFDGLNLTWETLEGLVKHNGPLTDREGTPCGHYREHG